MTEQEKQQLSRDVAEKYGIKPHSGIELVNEQAVPLGIYSPYGGGKWLHNASARCFELMVQHGVDVVFDRLSIFCMKKGRCIHKSHTLYTDHSTKHEATRIAILKALLTKEQP